MPNFVVTLPSGRKYRIEGAPDETTAYQWAEGKSSEEDAYNAQRLGFWGSIPEAMRTGYGAIPEAIGLTTGEATPQEEQQLLEATQGAPGYDWDYTKRTFRQEGVSEGLGELWGLTKQTLGQSIGMLAPATVAGVGAGAVSGPLAPVTAPTAFIGTLSAGTYPQMLSRQAYERQQAVEQGETPRDLEFGQAGTAAVGSAALDRALLGISGILPFRTASRASLAGERVIPSALRGTARTAAAEIPIEISQSAIERAQAGLSLTDEDALGEYEESAVGAALMAPAFGTVGRRMEVGRAQRDQRQELEQMEAARRQREAEQAALATEGAQTVAPGVEPRQEQPTLTRAEELRQAAEKEASRRNAAPDRRARSWTPEDVMQEKRGQVLEEIRSLERERNSIRETGDIEQAGELQKRVVSAYDLYSDLGGMTPQQAEKNTAAIKQTAARIKKLEKQFDEADTPQKVDEAVRGISEARKELDELRARQAVFDEFQPPEGQMGLDFEGGEGRFLTAESLRPIGRSRVVRDLEGADLTDPAQRNRAREVIEGLEPATKRETNAAREELLQRIAEIEGQQAQSLEIQPQRALQLLKVPC